MGDALGEHHTGEEIALRVLLPVQEMRLRRYLQRIGHDPGARMRRRAQADGLRPQDNRAVVTIRCAVGQRGLD